MSKGSAPPAPDYVGAAKETAAGNLQNLNQQTAANRPNQHTPWGSSTWTSTPNADGTTEWTNNISLSPEEQAALDSQQHIQQKQSQLAQTMQGQVSSQMANGFTAPSMSSYMNGVPSINANFQGFDQTGVASVDQSHINPNSYTHNYHGINQNFNSGAQQNTSFSGGPGLNNNFQTNTPGQSTTFNSGVPGANTTFASGANPVNQNFASSAGALQTSVEGSPVHTDPNGFTAGAGGVDLNAPQFDQASADAGAKAAYKSSTGMLTDQWQQDTKNLDSQLRMQGLTPGTEAYNNAMQNMMRVQGQQQDQLANQAVLTGNQLANNNYASALAGYQAHNAAQGQAFNQGLSSFGAANTALGQQFSQNLTGAQFGNAAKGQQFSQDLTGFNANNAAQQQQFSQDATGFGLTNDARNQAYANALSGYNATNQARNTQFGQDLSVANFNNAASAQQFQNNLAGYNATNAANNTQYQNDLSGFNANNTAATQGLQNGLAQYASALQGQSAYNTAAGQAYTQALGAYGVDQQAQLNANAAQQQSYAQAMQQYQTAYQDAYQNYLQPLNSMNAVLTGQQVNMPQMPGFTAAGYTPGADLSGAASSLGQYNSGLAAQGAANRSSTMGTVGSLAMAAAVAY
jgi:hypothetical protein